MLTFACRGFLRSPWGRMGARVWAANQADALLRLTKPQKLLVTLYLVARDVVGGTFPPVAAGGPLRFRRAAMERLEADLPEEGRFDSALVYEALHHVYGIRPIWVVAHRTRHFRTSL